MQESKSLLSPEQQAAAKSIREAIQNEAIKRSGQGEITAREVGMYRRQTELEQGSGMMEFLTAITPSILGGIGGGAAGSLLGPAGTLIGGIAGSVAGEYAGQEMGYSPRSDANLAISAAGPGIGAAVGKGYQLARRLVGWGASKSTIAKVATARNLMSEVADEFESFGTKVLAKQKGLMAQDSGSLYKAADNAKVGILTSRLGNTTTALSNLIQEMAPLRAYPEGRAAISFLKATYSSLLKDSMIPLSQLVAARRMIGGAVDKAERAGGYPLGTKKQVFKSISEDLESIAANPTRTGQAAQTALAATKRARLEFSIRDLEEVVSGATKVDGQDLIIDVGKIQNWVLDATNPKSAKFDKNFTEALKDEIPNLKEALADLAKQTKQVKPGGPASLVIRSEGAKTGRMILGGALGYAGLGPVGALIGGVTGAQAPEMMVALLTTKAGSSMLRQVTSLGKGNINSKTWQALGNMAARSLYGDNESKKNIADDIKNLAIGKPTGTLRDLTMP